MVVLCEKTVESLVSVLMLNEVSSFNNKRFTTKRHYNDLRLLSEEDIEYYFEGREYCWILDIDLNFDLISFLKKVTKQFPELKFIVLSSYQKEFNSFELYLKSSPKNVKLIHSKQPISEQLYSFLSNKKTPIEKFQSFVRYSTKKMSEEYNMLSVLLSQKDICELKDELKNGFIPNNVLVHSEYLLDKEREVLKQQVLEKNIQVDGEIVYVVSDSVDIYRLTYFFKKLHYINLNLKKNRVSLLTNFEVENVLSSSGVEQFFSTEIFRIEHVNFHLSIIHFKKGIEPTSIVECSQLLFNTIKEMNDS